MGGPGSGKADKVEKALVRIEAPWHIINTGSIIMDYLHDKLSEINVPSSSEDINNYEKIMDQIRQGDNPDSAFVVDRLKHEIASQPDVDGFLITGFPRDITQVADFELQVRESIELGYD